MKCKSCQEKIDPKFKHALSVNICPLCGSEIMDVQLQNLLGALKTALDNAKDYMSEVEDWLLTNYSLKKIDPNSTVDAFAGISRPATGLGKGTRVRRSDSDEDVETEVPANNTNFTSFAKRAGINPKSAVDFIKGKGTFGAADPSEFKEENEEGLGGSEENAIPLNSSDKNQLSSLFEGNQMEESLEIEKLKRLQAMNSGKFSRR